MNKFPFKPLHVGNGFIPSDPSRRTGIIVIEVDTEIYRTVINALHRNDVDFEMHVKPRQQTSDGVVCEYWADVVNDDFGICRLNGKRYSKPGCTNKPGEIFFCTSFQVPQQSLLGDACDHWDNVNNLCKLFGSPCSEVCARRQGVYCASYKFTPPTS